MIVVREALIDKIISQLNNQQNSSYIKAYMYINKDKTNFTGIESNTQNIKKNLLIVMGCANLSYQKTGVQFLFFDKSCPL